MKFLLFLLCLILLGNPLVESQSVGEDRLEHAFDEEIRQNPLLNDLLEGRVRWSKDQLELTYEDLQPYQNRIANIMQMRMKAPNTMGMMNEQSYNEEIIETNAHPVISKLEDKFKKLISKPRNIINNLRKKRKSLKGEYLKKQCDDYTTYVYDFSSISSIHTGENAAIVSGITAKVYISCIIEKDNEFIYDLQLRKVKKFQRGKNGDESVGKEDTFVPARIIQSISGKIRSVFIPSGVSKADELLEKAIAEAFQCVLDYRDDSDKYITEGPLARRIESVKSFKNEETGHVHVHSTYRKKDILETGDNIDIEDVTEYVQKQKLILDDNLMIVKSEIRTDSLFNNEEDSITEDIDGSEIKVTGGSNLYLVDVIKREEKKPWKVKYFSKKRKTTIPLGPRDILDSQQAIEDDDDATIYSHDIYVNHDKIDSVYPPLHIPGIHSNDPDSPTALFHEMEESSLLAKLEETQLDLEEARMSYNEIENDPKNITNINKFVPLMRRDKRHIISDFLIKQAKKRKGMLRNALLQVLAFSSNPRAHDYLLDLVIEGNKIATVVIHFVRKPQDALMERVTEVPMQTRPMILGSFLRKKSKEVARAKYQPFVDELIEDNLNSEELDSIVDGLKNMGKNKEEFRDDMQKYGNRMNVVIRGKIMDLYHLSEDDLNDPEYLFKRDHLLLTPRDHSRNDWDNTSWAYNGASSYKERQLDVEKYPQYKSYIGSKKFGYNSFNAQFTASSFAGREGTGCFGGNAKILNRLSAVGNFWGKPHRLLALETSFVRKVAGDIHKEPKISEGSFLAVAKLQLGRFTIFKLPLPLVCNLIRYEILEHMLVPAAHFKAYYPVGGVLLEAGVEFAVDVGLITEFEYCAVEDSMSLSVFGEIGPAAIGIAGLSVGVMDAGFEFLAAFWIQLGPSLKLGPGYSFNNVSNDLLGRVTKRDSAIQMIPLPVPGNNNTDPITESVTDYSSNTDLETIDVMKAAQSTAAGPLHGFRKKFKSLYTSSLRIEFTGFQVNMLSFRQLMSGTIFGPPKKHTLSSITHDGKIELEATSECGVCIGLNFGILPSFMRFSLFVRLFEVLPAWRGILWTANPLVIRPFTPLNNTERCFLLKDIFKKRRKFSEDRMRRNSSNGSSTLWDVDQNTVPIDTDSLLMDSSSFGGNSH